MTKKSFVFSLVLAVAFLVVANVKADIAIGTSVDKELTLLDTVTITGKPISLADSNEGITSNGAYLGIFPSYSFTITLPMGYDLSYVSLSSNARMGGLTIGGKELSSELTDIRTMFPNGSDPFYITGLSGDVFTMLFNTVNDMTSELEGETTFEDVEIVLSFYGTAGAGQGPGNSTPEPATLAVLGLGLAGLGTVARRRRK